MFNVNKVSTIVRIFVCALMLLSIAMPVFAAGEAADPFGLDAVGGSTGLSAGGDTGFQGMIGNIIKVALSFLGVVALVVVLIGGFKYMTAGGNDENAKKARQWIISGIIGLAIIISAWAMTQFIIDSLVEATQSDAVGE